MAIKQFWTTLQNAQNLSWFSTSWTPNANTAPAVSQLSPERQSQILNNLNIWLKNDSTAFSSLQAFQKAYSYSDSDPWKKAILDSFIKQNKPEFFATPWTSASIPKNNVNLKNTTITPSTVSNPWTWNSQFDWIATKDQINTNSFISWTTTNANNQNANLVAIQQSAQNNQNSFENLANQNAQNAQQNTIDAERIAEQRLADQQAQDVQVYIEQTEIQSKQNKRNIAAANLLASLTGWTGWSWETAYIRDTENEAIATIRNIEASKSATNRKYNTDLTELQAKLTTDIRDINDKYMSTVLNSRTNFLNTLLTIESTKWKNTQEALNMTYWAVKDFNSNLTSLTRESENLKLEVIKNAEIKRNNIANNELEALKINNQNAIDEAKLKNENEKNFLDQYWINSFADWIISWNATISTVPEKYRTAVLNAMVIRKLPAEIQSKVNNAMSVIPTQLKNSDKEYARTAEIAVEYFKQWFSEEDVKRKLVWINDAAPKELTNKIFSILNWDQIENIKNIINSWNVENIITKTENIAFDNIKVNPDIKSIVSTQAWLVLKVNNLLDSFSEDDKKQLWSVWTFVNNFLTWYGEKSNDKINKLQSLLASLNSEERKRLSWSSVTTSEEQKNIWLFWDVKMNFDSLKITMENTFQNNIVNKYNNTRWTAMLPRIEVSWSTNNDIANFILQNNNPESLYITTATANKNPTNLFVPAPAPIINWSASFKNYNPF